MPSSFGWSDVSTWNSAYDNMEKDYFGNASASHNVVVIKMQKQHGSFLQKKKLLVLQGLEDFIVVDTDDVFMILQKR